MLTLQQFGLESLSTDDRLALAQALWDSVDQAGSRENLSPEFLAELERRAALADANPDRGIPWETVRAQALARWTP